MRVLVRPVVFPMVLCSHSPRHSSVLKCLCSGEADVGEKEAGCRETKITKNERSCCHGGSPTERKLLLVGFDLVWVVVFLDPQSSVVVGDEQGHAIGYFPTPRFDSRSSVLGIYLCELLTDPNVMHLLLSHNTLLVGVASRLC